jgi:7-carboxy-7-deazaguanine synthase
VTQVSARKDRQRARPTLLVSEIYRTIQGESTRSGQPCTLVRLSGCGLRCSYCDTAHAFHQGEEQSLEEIVRRVRGLGTDLVLLTGGEPLEQVQAPALITALVEEGATVMVETGGHVDIGPARAAHTIVLDLKTPGSGMEHRNRWANLDHLGAEDEVKFVLTGRNDYFWARSILAETRSGDRPLSAVCPVLFSPAAGMLAPSELAAWILEDGLPVRLNLQLHKLIWPGAERGI